jgi:hypothetical protein
MRPISVAYSLRNADDVAWAAIDRSEPVDIVVEGWRVAFVKRSLPLCELFFRSGHPLRRHVRHLLAMALYGCVTPSLVGIYNHAVVAGMRATWRESGNSLIVSFRA